MTHLTKAPWLIVAAFFLITPLVAQKAKPKPVTAPKPIIFAVLDGGKLIEPVAAIDAGKLVSANEEDATPKTFAATYYKARTAYPLIFGGAKDGQLTIVKSNIGTECGGSSADTIARPVSAKLTGLVMALATNAKVESAVPGYRRRPTVEDRTEIEKVVRAEFAKHGVAAIALKTLRYHNLTALDLDKDDAPEFVGSYWIAPTPGERHMLFFIAERDGDGKITFLVSDYSDAKAEDVMSGDVKDLDTGVGHELLLDVMDVDGDGVKEIFTIGKAFEGNNYYVHKRMDGKWTKVHETYSYRCAF